MHGGGIVAQHMLVTHAYLSPLVQVLQPAQAQFTDVLGQVVVLGDLLVELRIRNTHSTPHGSQLRLLTFAWSSVRSL